MTRLLHRQAKPVQKQGGAEGKGTPAEKQYTDIDFGSCD